MKDILITLSIVGAISIMLIAIGGIGLGAICALLMLAGAVIEFVVSREKA